MPNTVLGFIGVGLVVIAAFNSAGDVSPHAMRNNILTLVIGILFIAIDAYSFADSQQTRLWRPGRRKCVYCHKWYTYKQNGLSNHWSNDRRLCPKCAKPKR